MNSPVEPNTEVRMISKSTGISIGLMLALMGSGLFGWNKIDSRLVSIESELREQKYILRNVLEHQQNNIQRAEMKLWIERMRRKYPDTPDFE